MKKVSLLTLLLFILLQGVHSQNGSTNISTPANTINSGFYDYYGDQTLPYWSWWHIITSRHINTQNDYSLQLISNFWNENDLFIRLNKGLINDPRGSLYRIWHSGSFNATNNQFGIDLKGLANAGLWANSDRSRGIYFGDNFARIRVGNRDDLLTVTNQGIGIGTSSPATPLEIAGTTRLTNGGATWDNLTFWSNGVSSFIQSNGDEEGLRIKSNTANKIILESNVGIGTNSPGLYQLAVEGTIGARKIKVTQTSWADDVFKPNYALPTLTSTKAFIQKNGHLPGIPAEKNVVGKDIDIAEMQVSLLRKIEELTLHLIKKDEEMSLMKKELAMLKKHKKRQ